MAVASYGSATTTSGVVRIVKDLDSDLTDRHVLVVEDIVDSGLTLSYLRRSLLARRPGQPRGVRAARQRRTPAGQAGPASTSGSTSPRTSSWATGSTWPSATATCPTSGSIRAPSPSTEPHPGSRCTGSVPVTVDRDRVERLVGELLEAIGEDPERDGLLATPRRVAAMYEELFVGDRRRSRELSHGHVRGGARRDGHGARHPLRVAVRAPHDAVHGQGARGLHPRRRRPGDGVVEAGPPRRRPTPGGCRSRSG